MCEVNHHNPPSDIYEGDTSFGHIEVNVDDVHVEVYPVEIFASHAWDAVSTDDSSVAEIAKKLKAFPDKAVIRVAVPGDGYHRILDITGVGFSAGDEEVNSELVVELVTERWDSGYPVIRPDAPTQH